MTNEMRSRIFVPVIGLCILALCMVFCTSNSYGAKNDESAKCFFAEGHKIVIEAITEQDRADHPEATDGKTVKIECYDSEENTVEETYYVTSDYTVYGGSKDSFLQSTEICMNSGKLHRIVAGSPSDVVNSTYVYINGGTVDQIFQAENNPSNANSIVIADDVTGPVDVWIGAEKKGRGSISSIYLDAGDNPNINLKMGYSDGNLISDINNAEDWSGFHINIDLNGSHLNGLQPFKETAGCVVNNEKTVMLDGRDGTFKKGETTLTYSVPLSEDDTINTDDLQKPEKKGYTFRGWVAYPENSIIENQIFRGSSGRLFATWRDNSDPEPYDCSVLYYDAVSGDEMESPIVFDDGGRAYLSKGFDREKGLKIKGKMPDGTEFTQDVNDCDPDNDIWYYAVNSKSVDKKVEKTYIVSMFESDSDYSTEGWGELTVSDPDSYNESTGVYEKSYAYNLEGKEAISENGATITLPYDSMRKKWKVDFTYYLVPNDIEENCGIKVGDTYTEGYIGQIELNGDKKITKKYEYKAEDGSIHDFRINLVESDGTSADLDNMQVATWDGQSYTWGDEKAYDIKEIDLEKAATAKGTEVAVPYYYDPETCGDVELSWYSEEKDQEIKGLEYSYTLDSNGEYVVKFSVTSANGKNTKNYKVKLAQDKTGDSTDMESLNLNYLKMHDSDADKSVPIDIEAAKSKEGAVVVLPENVQINKAWLYVQGTAKNYAVVDQTGMDYVDWEPDVYKRTGKYNKTSDTLEFTVTSANKKNTQKYKVTVWQKDAKQFKDISEVKISGIENQEYTGSAIKLNLVLTDGDKKLVEETDYAVKYENNTQAGTATIVITGKGNYTGSVTKQFRIYEPGGKEKDLFAKSDVVRFAGDTRYDTALNTADALKKSMGIDKFSYIIVADGNNYPDALAGSYLAKVKKAPLILVDRSVASEEVIGGYIKKNLEAKGTVYLLGGKDVVTERFEKSLKGTNVKRLAGDTRYETNLEILNEAKASKEDLLACTGEGFADSLSASAVGKPILLVDNRGLMENQKTYLNKADVQDIYLIGGADVVSDKVGKQLKTYDKDSKVERVAGSNRYKTSVEVAKTFFPDKCDTAVLAYGMKFPDGLAGGPLAISLKAPLLLVEDTAYADAREYGKTAGLKKLAALGGQDVISDKTVKLVVQ